MTGKITTIVALALGLAALDARAEPPSAPHLQPLALPADHATPLWRAQGDADQQAVIAEIQRHLQALGLYRDAIDGIAGPGTWGAINRFIDIAGLPGGDFGQMEFAILRRAAALHAEGGLDPAQAIRRAADPRLTRAYETGNRGMQAFQAGQYRQAEEAFQETFDIFSQSLGPAHPDTLATGINLAEALRANGRLAEAEAIYRRIVGPLARVMGEEHALTLTALSNKAAVIMLQGRPAESEALHQRVLATRERLLGADHPDTLTSRNNLGEAHFAQGRFREAAAQHRAVLEARERVLGRDDPRTLISRNNLARALQAQGRYSEAEALHRETLAMRDATLGPEHPHSLHSRNNLAVTLIAQNRHDEAEPIYREILATQTRLLGGDNPDTLATRNNLASTIEARGDHAAAEAMQRETLAIMERILGVDHPTTLSVRVNLADVIHAQGRHEEAETVLRRALAGMLATQGPEHPGTLAGRSGLGLSLAAQGRHQEAEAIHRETLAIRERVLGPEHPRTLSSRHNLGMAIEPQGRIDDALATIEEGFAHLPASYATTGAISLQLAPYLGWAWSADTIPDADRAARTFPAQGYLTYGDLDVALGDVAARQQVGDAATSAVLRAFQEAREDLQQLRRAWLASFEADSAVSEDARAQIQAGLRDAEARFAGITARIDRDFPALAELELPRALSADEAQALLEPGEGLLAFASLADHLFAWLVTPDAVTWHRLDAPRADLAARVAHLRASLDIDWSAPPPQLAPGCALASPDLPDHPFDLCAAQELHDLILGAIDLGGIDELIIIPDGPLESLPFAMLVTDHAPGAAPRWLVEAHAITTLPTTSSLRALRQGDTGGAEGRAPFLGLAPVEFDADSPDSALRGTSLARLPGSADEVRFLAGLMGAGADGAVIGEQASEAFVKTAPLDRYRVLSFATHGLLAREAEAVSDGAIREMALALRPGGGEDGLLTASEVAALRLDADWVLLSACNTAGGGGGDAQGLSGLARAFFFAGARALMVSHWPIDDAVTPQLMADTMQRSGEGLSRAQALRQAQLSMTARPESAHPFFWAPFSVVGENR